VNAGAQRPPTAGAPEADICQPRWVRLHYYCELTGETRSAVHNRRYCGQWRDGVHTIVDPSRRVWVNLDAAEDWLTTGHPLEASALQALRTEQRAQLRRRRKRRAPSKK
jgi:hypothetical protein